MTDKPENAMTREQAVTIAADLVSGSLPADKDALRAFCVLALRSLPSEGQEDAASTENLTMPQGVRDTDGSQSDSHGTSKPPETSNRQSPTGAAPHEHYEGQNECTICDRAESDRILALRAAPDLPAVTDLEPALVAEGLPEEPVFMESGRISYKGDNYGTGADARGDAFVDYAGDLRARLSDALRENGELRQERNAFQRYATRMRCARDAALQVSASAERKLAEREGQQYPDTEADGIVFCGKCGAQR